MVNPPSESESPLNSVNPILYGYLKSLSPSDIYGKRRLNPQRVPISLELYCRQISTQERWELAEKYGMQTIPGRHLIDGICYLEEEPFVQLTWWAPLHTERYLILQLARCVSQKGRKPTILDVGCGSGFLTRLLALGDNAFLVGVDPHTKWREIKADPTAPAPKNAQFVIRDLWEIISDYGPQYDTPNAMTRSNLLNTIRARCTGINPVFSRQIGYYTCGDPVQKGDPYVLNGEIRHLQRVAQQTESDSSIDVVLCSLMPYQVDLTVPIRDGLYPKAIVYVRLTNGLAGAGDYYLDPGRTRFKLEEDRGYKPTSLTPYTLISHNPGTNYVTTARWPTIWRDNWSASCEDIWSNRFSAEVIVQVRQDVILNAPKPLSVKRLPFDKELERAFRYRDTQSWEFFVASIWQAYEHIFGDQAEFSLAA